MIEPTDEKQQRDECYCDIHGIGDPQATCGDCPRDYGLNFLAASAEGVMVSRGTGRPTFHDAHYVKYTTS